MFIASQIVGIFALLAYIVSTQVNNRRVILFWLTIYNVLSATQYLLLGAMSGAISCIVPIVRNLVYRRYGSKKVPIRLIVFFCCLVLTLGLITFDNPISLLPIFHTIVFTIFIGLGDLTKFRFMSIVASVLMFSYNIIIGTYSGIAIVSAQLISTVVAAARFDREFYKKFFHR